MEYRKDRLTEQYATVAVWLRGRFPFWRNAFLQVIKAAKLPTTAYSRLPNAAESQDYHRPKIILIPARRSFHSVSPRPEFEARLAKVDQRQEDMGEEHTHHRVVTTHMPNYNRLRPQKSGDDSRTVTQQGAWVSDLQNPPRNPAKAAGCYTKHRFDFTSISLVPESFYYATTLV